MVNLTTITQGLLSTLGLAVIGVSQWMHHHATHLVANAQINDDTVFSFGTVLMISGGVWAVAYQLNGIKSRLDDYERRIRHNERKITQIRTKLGLETPIDYDDDRS